MQAYERYDLLISGFGLLANFSALVFIAVQLTESRRTARSAAEESARENVRRSRQATLDYYYETFVIREELLRKLPTHDDPESVTRAISKALSGHHDELRADIKSYLNYFETLSGGVNLGIYDIETIDRLTGTRIISTFRRWTPYIDRVREKSGRPSLYAEFEILATKLEHRRAANPTSAHDAHLLPPTATHGPEI